MSSSIVQVTHSEPTRVLLNYKITNLGLEYPMAGRHVLRHLQHEDAALLQAAVRLWHPLSQSYEHSWGYVIQAIRNEGMLWHDPTSCLVFLGRKPDQPDTLVVPTFFARPACLARCILQAQEVTATSRTIVKNVDLGRVHEYSSFGFRPYRSGEAWSAEARYDDQTYPQVVVDLRRLVMKQGHEYRRLRKAVRRGDAAGYRMRPYQEDDRDAVMSLFDGHDASLAIPRFRAAHAVYLEADLPRLVAELHGQVVGFTATSVISEASASLCAAIFARELRALGPWGQYQAMVGLFDAGFESVNLGGSEASGTMQFKQQLFRPCRTIARTHLVFSL